jgi:predicted dehydrogenase
VVVVRFGLVGVNTSHADAFSRIFNGSSSAPPTLAGGEIVAVWGGDANRTSALAAEHNIGAVVNDPSELRGIVDAVLVVDDTGGGASHAELARPFLEAGMPVFVDKPMTTEYPDAVALFEVAQRHSAPLLSCSALRFAVELDAARPEVAAAGALSSVVAVGPNEWFYYGVHVVELLGAVVGVGARWVHRHVFPDRDVVVIDYAEGPTAVVETLRDAKYIFDLTAYGADGRASFQVVDAAGFYTNTMRQVLAMAQTGRSPLAPEQTLEVLAILTAGNRSAETGERVALDEVRRG